MNLFPKALMDNWRSRVDELSKDGHDTGMEALERRVLSYFLKRHADGPHAEPPRQAKRLDSVPDCAPAARVPSVRDSAPATRVPHADFAKRSESHIAEEQLACVLAANIALSLLLIGILFVAFIMMCLKNAG